MTRSTEGARLADTLDSFDGHDCVTATATVLKAVRAAAVIIRDMESDAKLGKELCAILIDHTGERGDSEGAVETLSRILRERNAACKPS